MHAIRWSWAMKSPLWLNISLMRRHESFNNYCLLNHNLLLLLYCTDHDDASTILHGRLIYRWAVSAGGIGASVALSFEWRTNWQWMLVGRRALYPAGGPRKGGTISMGELIAGASRDSTKLFMSTTRKHMRKNEFDRAARLHNPRASMPRENLGGSLSSRKSST